MLTAKCLFGLNGYNSTVPVHNIYAVRILLWYGALIGNNNNDDDDNVKMIDLFIN